MPQMRRKFFEDFQVKSRFTFCVITSENFSMEKQTVFHFSPLSHKEITHNCFNYWRRREPPVFLSCGENSSRIFSKVKNYLLFYKKQKFFTGKTNGSSSSSSYCVVQQSLLFVPP